jgi:AcrR family transcriptional regulator
MLNMHKCTFNILLYLFQWRCYFMFQKYKMGIVAIINDNKTKKRRYDRDAWLATALDVLSHEGQARLTTKSIASKLGVTRGSFYHHFKSRGEFVKALVNYWSEIFTGQVNNTIGISKLSPEERLLLLMRLIHQQGLDRYDIAFRSWAAQDSKIAKEVRKVDLIRYSFVKSIFSEMGFHGDELEDRVRIWLVFQCSQNTVYLPEPWYDDDAILRLHTHFVRPCLEN